MKYLKERQYYDDLYDLHTIEICIDWIKLAVKKCDTDKAFAKFSEKEQIRGKNILVEIPVYYNKGERYRDKEKTISEWILRDKTKQDKYDNAKEPDEIFCQSCNWAMESTTKLLHDFTDEPLRVLFFFECPHCHKRRGIFDDGGEYVSKPNLCPKCSGEIGLKFDKKGDVSVFTEKCKSCNFVKVDETNHKVEDEKREKQKQREQYLLKTYRGEFCLSKEAGEKYIAQQTQTEYFFKKMDETKIKEADPNYRKAKSLRRLKAIELQNLISEVVKPSGFDNLNFEKPEIDRHVIISFTVQETKVARSDYDACRDLRRALEKSLVDTNWRLMSDGISTRLGLLYGRVKGYENEDDLMKIVQ